MKMSIISFTKFLLFLLLVLNPPSAFIPRGHCVAAARPLKQKDYKYINLKLKPKKGDGKKRGYVEACLPKGLIHSSAPSRYINSLPLGISPCYSSKVENSPRPWSWPVNMHVRTERIHKACRGQYTYKCTYSCTYY